MWLPLFLLSGAPVTGLERKTEAQAWDCLPVIQVLREAEAEGSPWLRDHPRLQSELQATLSETQPQKKEQNRRAL